MSKAIWLSYDLGIKGDYEGLYGWLDDREAKECGDNVAFFNYEPDNGKNLVEQLKDDISQTVDINKRDRIYIIWKEGETTKGKFLFGKRKSNPWTGYGIVSSEEDEDS